MVPIINDQDGRKAIHETGIHLLLEHGASVAAADPEGETSLHAAAFGAPLRLFRHVLRLATNSALSATNNHGETLLHYAAAGANVSVLRYILESTEVDIDLDVNAASSNGWTPLLCALALTAREEGQRTQKANGPLMTRLKPRGSSYLGAQTQRPCLPRAGLLCTASRAIRTDSATQSSRG